MNKSLIISHKANLSGPNPETENKPEHIEWVIKQYDLDCEVDIWNIHNEWYLGHDYPQYKIDYFWLLKYKKWLWLHCKNLLALDNLSSGDNFNCFWHENDGYTLTSKGYIWTFPNYLTTSNCIIVLKNENDVIPSEAKGICTDFSLNYV